MTQGGAHVENMVYHVQQAVETAKVQAAATGSTQRMTMRQFKGITHGGLYIFIYLGLLPLCTES